MQIDIANSCSCERKVVEKIFIKKNLISKIIQKISKTISENGIRKSKRSINKKPSNSVKTVEKNRKIVNMLNFLDLKSMPKKTERFI